MPLEEIPCKHLFGWCDTDLETEPKQCCQSSNQRYSCLLTPAKKSGILEYIIPVSLIFFLKRLCFSQYNQQWEYNRESDTKVDLTNGRSLQAAVEFGGPNGRCGKFLSYPSHSEGESLCGGEKKRLGRNSSPQKRCIWGEGGIL